MGPEFHELFEKNPLAVKALIQLVMGRDDYFPKKDLEFRPEGKSSQVKSTVLVVGRNGVVVEMDKFIDVRQHVVGGSAKVIAKALCKLFFGVKDPSKWRTQLGTGLQEVLESTSM